MTNSCIKVIIGAFGIPKIDYCNNHLIPKKGSSPTPAECGQDSYFIKETEKVVGLGIADGVTGYNKFNIDSGKIARALMLHSSELIDSGVNFGDCGNVIRVALYQLIEEKMFKGKDNVGGTTSLIAKIDKDTAVLEYGNLGDCKCIVLSRNKVGKYRIGHKSEDNLEKFNTPYHSVIMFDQLNSFIDDCDYIITQELALKAGDVILLMSDGVVDNVFDHELEKVVNEVLKISKNDARQLAESISFLAFNYSQYRCGESPFYVASQEAGVERDDCGGKPDDITVVAAIIQ